LCEAVDDDVFDFLRYHVIKYSQHFRSLQSSSNATNKQSSPRSSTKTSSERHSDTRTLMYSTEEHGDILRHTEVHRVSKRHTTHVSPCVPLCLFTLTIFLLFPIDCKCLLCEPLRVYIETHSDTRRPETHRDTGTSRHTATHRVTQRHKEAYRAHIDTQRHTEVHRDTQRHTETHGSTQRSEAYTDTQRAVCIGYVSPCASVCLCVSLCVSVCLCASCGSVCLSVCLRVPPCASVCLCACF
jgi:hypothetical protein